MDDTNLALYADKNDTIKPLQRIQPQLAIHIYRETNGSILSLDVTIGIKNLLSGSVLNYLPKHEMTSITKNLIHKAFELSEP